MPGPPSPTYARPFSFINATNAGIDSSSLVYTTAAGESANINLSRVVCTLRRSWYTGTAGLVCCVSEDVAPPPNPYQLIIISSARLDPELFALFPPMVTIPPHLQSAPDRMVAVIVSIKSGLQQALGCYHSVLQPLLSWLSDVIVSRHPPTVQPAAHATPSVTYTTEITSSPETIRIYAQNLRRTLTSDSTKPMEVTIILLSGDGGVADLLNGQEVAPEEITVSHRPTIALLPLGTGNALFHSLHRPLYTEGGPTPLVLGLRTLLTGEVQPLPMLIARFSGEARLIHSPDNPTSAQAPPEQQRPWHLFGAVVASYALHASLVWESDTEEYRKYGVERFGMVAKKLLEEGHAYQAEVEIRKGDGEIKRLERPAFGYLLASMVSNLEKDFTISPATKPCDKKLRLLHLGAIGGQKTMEVMMEAYKEGAHVRMKWTGEDGKEDGVGYEDIEGFQLTVNEKDPRWRKVCVDGTIVELEEGGAMKVDKMGGSHYNILVNSAVLLPEESKDDQN